MRVGLSDDMQIINSLETIKKVKGVGEEERQCVREKEISIHDKRINMDAFFTE